MKPKILIVGEDGFAMDTGHFIINLEYANAVTKGGGLPLMAFDWNSAADYVEMADGLLLTGGPDLLCYRYGQYYKDFTEMPPFSRTRDDLDFELCERFLKAGKPIFGIGRGCEVINVALGGTLYKDIAKATGKAHPTEDTPATGWNAITQKAAFSFHTVDVQPDTRLSAVLNKTEQVGSCHHDAPNALGTGLRAAALAPDGIIEAIEHETLPVFGVMWHPERAAGDLPADDRIFHHFIELCQHSYGK